MNDEPNNPDAEFEALLDAEEAAERADDLTYTREMFDKVAAVLMGEPADVVVMFRSLVEPEDGPEVAAAFKLVEETIPVLYARLYEGEVDQS